MSQFSVLISLYDKETPPHLESSLKSIQQQTRQPDEVVIVFDGPINAELRKVVAKYSSSLRNVKIVELEKNGGLGNALREGLKHCNYSYVARMDTDDICLPERFQKQMEHLEANPQISVLGTAIEEFNTIPGDLGHFRKLPTDSGELQKFAKFRNPLNHPTVLFKKEDVLATGSYEDMPLFEDYYLWCRMLAKDFRIENLEDRLLYFRIGNDMIGRRHGTGYLKKEIRFLNALKKMGFLSARQWLVLSMVKLPLRLVPKKALSAVYKRFLRK